LVVGLRQRGIGLGGLNLGRELCGLLGLNGAIDDRKRLTRANPASGIDQNGGNPATRARNPDLLVTFCPKRSTGRNHSRDRRIAGHDHGNGGHLACAGASGGSRGVLL
jgi:hypothetical protein